MILPPRTLALRLFFWTALLVYAIWNLRGRSSDELVVPEQAPAPPAALRVPLPAPGPTPTPAGEAPAIVDVEAAVTAMDTAAGNVAACGVTGTVGVRLAAAGLAEAWLLPPPDPPPPDAVTCAARAVWAAAWPATTQGFEMERAIGP